MTVPIVICDDSSFARKQMARALPKGWDVEVTFASGGPQALDAIRAGKGDILFLDLTMPDMDGFAVLEVIRREDLPTMTIVVSGDVQPESRQRALQLGAVAFVAKPVDGERLGDILRDYGVLGVLTGEEAAVGPAVAFTDWVQELCNVAMGRAAELLATIIEEGVEMSVPKVSFREPGEIDMMLGAVDADSGFAIVTQGFIGGGVGGEILILFNEADTAELARLMRFDEGPGLAGEAELFNELANVLVGAFLKDFADQLDLSFSQGQPLVHAARAQRVRCRAAVATRLLTVELGYRIGSAGVHCDQLVLFTAHALARLEEIASYVLE